MNLKIKFLSIASTIILSLVNISCSKDPCDDVSCVRGSCSNGACVCPEGYEGSDCSKQVTPKKVLLTYYEVQSFPVTKDNGAGWDSNSGPDITVKIEKGNAIVWESSYYTEDASASQIHFENLDTEFNFEDPQEQYAISIYDIDAFSNEFMTGIYFYPYSSTGGFPETVTLDAGAGFKIVISLKYIF